MVVVQPEGDELPYNEKRIIATLWKCQTQSFGNDFSKKRTVLIYSQSLGFANYIKGVVVLLDKQLLQILNDGQILLFDLGIEYMQAHPDPHNFQFTYNF